jgi:hypothetical protein
VALMPRYLVPLAINWAHAPALASSTPLRSLSVIPRASRSTVSLLSTPGAARPRSAGSTGSSCIWSSMIVASCWRCV